VAALPSGRLEWVVGGGHVVMEEVPESVNAMLLAFVGA
jgi:pimeloyl-ACP methyl ester carboxylesterase